MSDFLAMVDAVPPWSPAPDPELAGDVPTITATPFVWRDPALIPPRQFLHGRHYVRGFVSVCAAPGGLGKSSLKITTALSMATGLDLLNVRCGRPLRVWIWNLEDPADELERRIAAGMIHFGIGAGAIGDRLFVDSGRNQSLCIATERHNGFVIEPVVDSLVDALRDRKIDVLIVDPFVSSHAISENDNGQVDAVAKAWGRVAERAGCAVELVHHLRKTGGMEATAEFARGAVSLIGAARSVEILNRMTPEEATRAGVENHRAFFRATLDKANLTPPADKATWFQLVNVSLPNGDHVGVVEPWAWPDAFDGAPIGGFTRRALPMMRFSTGRARSRGPSRKSFDGPGFTFSAPGKVPGWPDGKPCGGCSRMRANPTFPASMSRVRVATGGKRFRRCPVIPAAPKMLIRPPLTMPPMRAAMA